MIQNSFSLPKRVPCSLHLSNIPSVVVVTAVRPPSPPSWTTRWQERIESLLFRISSMFCANPIANPRRPCSQSIPAGVFCSAGLCWTLLKSARLHWTLPYYSRVYLTLLYALLDPTVVHYLLYSTLLCWTFLFCTVLYCYVLYCSVLWCTALFCTTVLRCNVLHCVLKPRHPFTRKNGISAPCQSLLCWNGTLNFIFAVGPGNTWYYREFYCQRHSSAATICAASISTAPATTTTSTLSQGLLDLMDLMGKTCFLPVVIGKSRKQGGKNNRENVKTKNSRKT